MQTEIKINLIDVDTNQPRQFFDQDALNDLSNSIREKGVLQPIMLTPSGKRYKLVYGERRLRAAAAAGLKTIPAIVRELSDREVLELQVIENMQRADVHPLEEAQSFKRLQELNNYSELEIGNRIGKSASYVAKRLKLNDLADDAKLLFGFEKITLSTAMDMSKLSEDIQKEIIDGEFGANWKSKSVDRLDVLSDIDYYLRDELKDLSKATFDISDENLYPEAGSCIGCKFNTASAPLLFEDATPKCSRPSCFENKKAAQLKADFDKVAADPSIICISPDIYLTSDDKKQLQIAEDCGLKILDKKLYTTFYEPDKLMDFEEWKDYEGIDEDDDLQDVANDYDKYKADNEKEFAEYEELKSKGLLITAFVVAGNSCGEYKTIKLKDEGAKEIADSGNSESTDIIAEIAAIKSREARNKELDEQKVWEMIRGELLGRPELTSPGQQFKELQVACAVTAILEALSYTKRREAQKYLETVDGKNGNEVINTMLRYLIIDKLISAYGSHLAGDTDNTLAYRYIKDILPAEIARIELKQEEIAINRAERVEKRIAALKKKIKSTQTV